MTVKNDYELDKDNFSKYKEVPSLLKYGKRKEGKFDLSFVIPTYRKPNKLKDALQSVMGQERAGLKVEVIIVDNDFFDLSGSETEVVLKQYAEKDIAYYQNEKNIGMYGNWNRCIELAKSEWVSMLHDDDFLAPNYFVYVKKILNTTKRHDKIIFVRSMSVPMHAGKIDERTVVSRFIHHTFQSKLMVFNARDYDIIGPNKIGILGAPSCGTLMKRETYLKYGGFDESHSPSADVYYPERLVTRHGYKAALTVGVLGYARFDDNTSLKEKTLYDWANEYVVYTQYYKNRSIFSRWLFKYFENEMGMNQRHYYEQYIEKSDYIKSKQDTRKKLDSIMKYKCSRARYIFYNYFLWRLYYRFKQVVAIIKN